MKRVPEELRSEGSDELGFVLAHSPSWAVVLHWSVLGESVHELGVRGEGSHELGCVLAHSPSWAVVLHWSVLGESVHELGHWLVKRAIDSSGAGRVCGGP